MRTDVIVKVFRNYGCEWCGELVIFSHMEFSVVVSGNFIIVEYTHILYIVKLPLIFPTSSSFHITSEFP